ncbi:IMS domain-containing protein [Roseofilum sp. BLCC_M154]|uniref:IMS domain-containing protein n=1 Tax=Roseofilum acuticapitatum BLCC-M154 TaxID=3022444 RepID=A0ABT7AM26_9CYAN|nr:IMS domain-containing protein [Roseofilum acuticapitatum]MDJ1167941.1 IMS domain-containing protein [Roseofilum acuticapitatum BLCC-M154]
MRIPLDYYRILGVPLQATAEQLQQAHRDRTMQLPRREYSETAIGSRKSLLDRAYSILSNPEAKTAYDQKTFHALPGQAQEEKQIQETLPSLELEDPHILGALLILLELGEYELVLNLGQEHLENLASETETGSQLNAIPQLSRADIVLTVALSGLELGREQWQQGTYEQAALSLEKGEKLLLKEGVFPGLRGELQGDLYKLRPYRILELLSQNANDALAHRHGIQMLRDMLEERGGLDGTGDDRSGLSIDDFLRFIQQLRSYLTSLEQQTLFETEAQRPSAVATYLAVYALLVRGFAYKQPALINRAKRMLMRLGSRQDVHLEQAVCSLLLGQTEEASQALDLSREYEQLAFIRENSQGAPDLLPGLCLYSERWLHEEVFPHFQDLAECKQTLKEYFADDQVQAYLEALPLDRSEKNQWSVVESTPERTTMRESAEGGNLKKTEDSQVVPSPSLREGGETQPKRSAARTATLTRSEPTQVGDRPKNSPSQNDSRDRRENQRPVQRRVQSRRGSSKTVGRSIHWGRLALLVAGGLLGLWIFIWLIGQVLGLVGSLFNNTPTLEGEQLQLMLNQPPVEIPEPPAQPTADTGPLTEEKAKTVVETWLSTKAKAFGSSYELDLLSSILVDPALSTQRQRATQDKQDNFYGDYEHQVTINEVTVNRDDANRATVDATVNESVEFYRNGEVDRGASYSEEIRVQYQLIRQEGQWRIQDWSV